MNFQIYRDKLIVFIAALVSLVVLLNLFVKYEFYEPAVVDERVICLSNSDLEQVGYEGLLDSLILPNLSKKIAFKIYADYIKLPEKIKNGRYKLAKSMSVVDMANMLKLGWQEPTNIVFNNIRTPQQLAGRLSQQIEADSMALIAAFDAEFKKSGVDILTITVPDTYQVYWTITPEEFIERMRRESERFWSGDRDDRRKSIKLSRAEVISLAAIVDEETNQSSEMARIAGVYLNRLRRGMKLQSDPTVKYAVGDFGLKRILYEHLKIDSPYNTYLYKGLPPTPIFMPSIAAIDGVLGYEKHSYLFFCARASGDGFHDFATTYGQHLTYARAYQAELNRRKIK